MAGSINDRRQALMLTVRDNSHSVLHIWIAIPYNSSHHPDSLLFCRAFAMILRVLESRSATPMTTSRSARRAARNSRFVAGLGISTAFAKYAGGGVIKEDQTKMSSGNASSLC